MLPAQDQGASLIIKRQLSFPSAAGRAPGHNPTRPQPWHVRLCHLTGTFGWHSPGQQANMFLNEEL